MIFAALDNYTGVTNNNPIHYMMHSNITQWKNTGKYYNNLITRDWSGGLEGNQDAVVENQPDTDNWADVGFTGRGAGSVPAPKLYQECQACTDKKGECTLAEVQIGGLFDNMRVSIPKR